MWREKAGGKPLSDLVKGSPESLRPVLLGDALGLRARGRDSGVQRRESERALGGGEGEGHWG